MLNWKRRRDRKATRVSVSPAFLLLLLLFAAVDRQRLLFHILLAAAVHECGHVAVLRFAGGHVSHFRITLFGAELRIDHSERLSYGREIAAVLAGPSVNLICAFALAQAALYTGWERAFMLSGIHAALALFNLLPLRVLDGGRCLYLLLAWMTEPVTADRIMHGVSCMSLCVLLLLCAAILGAIGAELPLLMLESWFVFCWFRETGIVK